MVNIELKDNKRITDISFILKDFLKVIKVVSLYPENNPLPQSLKRSFAERLQMIVESYGDITIIVKKDRLLYQNEVVFKDRPPEDYLASIFFEIGITSFTIKEIIDINEVYRFLKVMKEYVNNLDKSDDLISLIWEADVSFISFETLENKGLSQYDDFDFNEFLTKEDDDEQDWLTYETGSDKVESYDSIFDNQESSSFEEKGNAIENNSIFFSDLSSTPSTAETIDETSLKTSEAATSMGYGDLSAQANFRPDISLIMNDEFKLSEEEREEINGLIANDDQFDPYESTLALLKEILLQESEMNSFYESVTICEKMLTEFLQKGRFIEASQLLGYLNELEKEIKKEKPLWAERLKEVVVTAGSRDRLKILEEVLNKNDQITSLELKNYIDNFDWEVLGIISELITKLIHKHHKECLKSFLVEKAKGNLDIIAKNIFDKRKDIVINTISILSQIGNDRAIVYLSKVVHHEDDEIRLHLVSSLKNCSSDSAISILKEAFHDNNSEVRKEAVNTLVVRRGVKAFEAITSIINDDNFSLLEQAEQQVLLNTFSILGGEKAVGFLSQLILKFNHFHNPMLTFYRQAAFEALSKNKSEKCEKLLLKLSHSWRADIKKKAQETLHCRREYIYGEL